MMFDLICHGFDEDCDLESGERDRVIVFEDEGEIIREERQRIKDRKIIAMVGFCFTCEV